MRKIVGSLIVAAVLVQGCATATRIVTSPAAIVTCPAKALLNHQDQPAMKVAKATGMVVVAPFYALAGILSGIFVGPVQDTKDLVDGSPTDFEEAASIGACKDF